MDRKVSHIGIIAVQSQPVAVDLKKRLIDMAVFDAVNLAIPSTMPVSELTHLTLFCDMATWKHVAVLPYRIERLVLIGLNNHDALEAFTHNAFSFLTTPLVDEQVEKVCQRLKQQRGNDEIVSKWRAIQHGLSQQLGISKTAVSAHILRFCEAENDNVLVLKTLTNTVFLPWQDIIKIEAEGDYMQVFTKQDPLIVRSSMGALLKKLDNQHFLRISRSLTVNMRYVVNIFCDQQSNYYVQLTDNSVAKFSTRWFEQYRNRLH
ncbi:LytTR family transcriptional regulator [Alteromonas ponticola]|uniref:LytTR family transcriptional regulator n=1 Tax=Alteromonas aquimaris TaxID=2998417 RepID=A0ABT3P2E2_9ALTE|nr:LytTR family DNA-binding domain-containing protein [Alteromonas aquimaris]MCW8106928.1 LytTR family transcriptional regulator [Alteromonas aquimaris]